MSAWAGIGVFVAMVATAYAAWRLGRAYRASAESAERALAEEGLARARRERVAAAARAEALAEAKMRERIDRGPTAEGVRDIIERSKS